MKASKIQLTSIEDASRRFDPSYHLSDAIVVKKTIAKSPYPLLKLKEVSSGIFNGGRYKRVYVSNPKHGYKFLSSSDILAADLESVKMVSKRYMGGVKELALEKGWILITRRALSEKLRSLTRNILRAGAIYAYLASKYGYILLTQGTFGAVIQHIECPFVGEIPIPNFPKTLQESIDLLIQESARLRESAADELEAADKLLKKKAGLRSLTPEDYDYFGQHSATRKPSCFTRKVSEFGSITFNAFNNSERIKAIISSIPESHLTIKDVIENGETFSSTGAPSIEVKPHCGIMLINQKDIFDTIVTGKYISRRGVKTDNLVKYGEVLIASDGTLGENETFCRAIYANEDLEGAFISSHFIRMKSNDKVPAGYLYCWLNSDYGFRLIRRTQAGTKICHPINRMFLDIPVPILAKEDMNKIDRMVRNAHTKRHLANEKELKAIAMVEAEIEKWN